MENLKFILRENVDRWGPGGELLPDKVSTLGFKFNENGEEYGSYFVICKPTVKASDIIEVLPDVFNEAIRLCNEIREHPAAAVIEIPDGEIGKVSDGYHTFNELYHHRAILFSVICNSMPDKAWKSKKHDTGDMFDGMFIVGIETPEGQATYHYDIEPYWDMFKVRELEKAPEWDGHTPQVAIERIQRITTDIIPIKHGTWKKRGNSRCCSECGFIYYSGNGAFNFCPSCGDVKNAEVIRKNDKQVD